MTFRLS